MIEADIKVESHSQTAKTVFNECGHNVNLCYRYRKYVADFPVSYVIDHMPVQLIQGMDLGMDCLVPDRKTMWLCASYGTCTTRYPQDVDIAKFLDEERITGLHQGIKPHCTEEFCALL